MRLNLHKKSSYLSGISLLVVSYPQFLSSTSRLRSLISRFRDYLASIPARDKTAIKAAMSESVL